MLSAGLGLSLDSPSFSENRQPMQTYQNYWTQYLTQSGVRFLTQPGKIGSMGITVIVHRILSFIHLYFYSFVCDVDYFYCLFNL